MYFSLNTYSFFSLSPFIFSFLYGTCEPQQALQKEAESRKAEQLAELGSCSDDKDALRQEVEVVKGEAGQLAEKAAEAESARVARKEAEKRAAELVRVNKGLDRSRGG